MGQLELLVAMVQILHLEACSHELVAVAVEALPGN
jgi:hypothetical protein